MTDKNTGYEITVHLFVMQIKFWLVKHLTVKIYLKKELLKILAHEWQHSFKTIMNDFAPGKSYNAGCERFARTVNNYQ